MDELLGAFALGNAAILTNACLLPLYPGVIAFLAAAGPAGGRFARLAPALLGLVVLAGVLTAMMSVGLVLAILSASFSGLLPILLPAVYLAVIALGVAMLADRNPFARMAVGAVRPGRRSGVTAFLYGLLLGPMTLPCTGPVILGAFALGTGAGEIASGLAYFLAFGLGFGWPLAVIPLLAAPVQGRTVRWLARNHLAFTRASGVLMIAIGLFGAATELLPAIAPEVTFVLEPAFWLAWWTAAVAVVVAVAALTVRGAARAETTPARG